MNDKNAYRLQVQGLVQGVGYRYFAKLMADRLNIVGDVKNLKNGDVELHIYTNDESKEKYLRQLWRGPQFSRVTHIDVEEIDFEPTDNFKIMFK